MANEKWNVIETLRLVACRDPQAIRELEQQIGSSQAAIVDAFIEETYWGN